LAAGALDWLLGSARDTETGLMWTATPTDDEVDPTLYSGGAGIVFALLEAQRHFGDDRYGDAALRSARAIAAVADQEKRWSLYFGLTGMAVALHAVHDRLGDTSSGAAARTASDRMRAHFDGQRWSAMFELLGGNAGIALGALSAGDRDLALLAVAYQHRSEPGRVPMTMVASSSSEWATRGIRPLPPTAPMVSGDWCLLVSISR
jgi:hypothetical protein